jgi:hypothetical protein
MPHDLKIIIPRPVSRVRVQSPPRFRYFRHARSVWKMPVDGVAKGFTRLADRKEWVESIADLENLVTLGFREISEGEGEP